jgi:hypothetical protein
MLDRLLANLYHRQMKKLKNPSGNDMSILMRKKRFIDEISIDD